MKILITGASGMIGGEVFRQCLAHPSVSKVVAFGRRALPAEVARHPKLECVIIDDFSTWPKAVLQEHADAAAMIWSMGTSDSNTAANLDYPFAFVESMGSVLQSQSREYPFRFIYLSGKFVRQNQDEKLWLLEQPRKNKGLLETRALAYAETHPATWKTFIVRPGGVVTPVWVVPGLIATMLGENWGVRVEELAAFMVYLGIDGQEEEESLIANARIVRKGKDLLEG